jgi:tRNA threonylcarbamoyladenosine biosynthesis protein TsaB
VILLGLDTATAATVAGVLGADGSVVEVRDDPAPGARPGHANRLLAAAEEAFERAGVGWEEVERLAVGVGPGSFTGLRIGIATARALAQARGLPLVGVSSLEALARGAASFSGAAPRGAGEPPLVLAVLDARRGEAFAAAWRGAARVLAAAALSPDALAERVRALPVPPLAVGDGAVRFRDPLEAAGALVPPDQDGVHRLRAEHVCRLGAAGTPIDRDALLPDYLREPDAVPRQR